MNTAELTAEPGDCAASARWPKGKAKAAIGMVRRLEDIDDVWMRAACPCKDA